MFARVRALEDAKEAAYAELRAANARGLTAGDADSFSLEMGRIKAELLACAGRRKNVRHVFTHGPDDEERRVMVWLGGARFRRLA
jgi:hypothetical protein